MLYLMPAASSHRRRLLLHFASATGSPQPQSRSDHDGRQTTTRSGSTMLHGPNNHPGTRRGGHDDDAARRKFLEHALLDHPYESTMKSSNELSGALSATEGTTTSNPPLADDVSMAPCCPICLDEFRKGDSISCSFNRWCPHKFHRNCIQHWLMNDDTCPCCRQSFLVVNDNTQGNATETTDAAVLSQRETEGW